MLVHAAAGGVGSIAVQWLKAIGATVIAHSGSAAKAALAIELGADVSLDLPDGRAGRRRCARRPDGDGVPVVLDGVGAASWEASLASVARRGLVVSYGNASGPVPPFTPLDLSRRGSIFVTRPTLADYCATPEDIGASAARLFEMIGSGKVDVRIGTRFPLADAAEAHRALEGRNTTGSTVSDSPEGARIAMLARSPRQPVRGDGAQERTRTSTPLRAPAPEAGASTNSATWAQIEGNQFGRAGRFGGGGAACQCGSLGAKAAGHVRQATWRW